MLLNAYEFMRSVAMYRIVYIGGKPGNGKTALSLYIAAWLCRNNWAAYVSSNIPIKGAVQPFRLPVPYTHSAIIMDESWLYMASWAQARKYMAFVRKLKHFFILPSVWDVHQNLQTLSTWRVFNFYGLGIPLWIYRWAVDTRSFKYGGYFGIWKPSRVFGMYDTDYVPESDGGIFDALMATYQLQGFKEGRLKEANPDGTEKENIGEAISDAAADFAAVGRKISTSLSGKRRR